MNKNIVIDQIAELLKLFNSGLGVENIDETNISNFIYDASAILKKCREKYLVSHKITIE